MDLLQNDKHTVMTWAKAGVEYCSKFFLLLYIFTMPFVSAFSFSDIISLPLIFAAVISILMGLQIIKTGKLPVGFLGLDILIFFLLFFLVLSSYCINGWGNSKSLNHTIAYISSISLFYIAIKFTLFQLSDKNELLLKVLQVISYATIVSAFYVNAEFILANFFELDLNDYIPRPSEEQMFYKPYVIGLFFRARGFASESGAYTQMVELFAPLTVYYMFFSSYCKWSVWFKITTVILIVISIIFAASSATFIIVPIAVLISVLVYIKKIVIYLRKKSIIFFLKTAIVLSFIILISNYFSIYANIILSLTDKADSSSFDDRKERIDFFYSKFSNVNIVNKLIGTGPAGFDVLGFDNGKSIISLYYNITFELGLIGFFLLLLFLLYFFFSVFSLNSKLGFFLLIAFLSGTMHYYVMNNYWVPWFWFIGAIAIYCRSHNLMDTNPNNASFTNFYNEPLQ